MHGSLLASWVSPQTASWSLQPYLHTTSVWQHTDTQTTLRTTAVAIGRIWCTSCMECGLKIKQHGTTLLLARLIGQYCFARWRLSSVGVVCIRRLSSSVTLPAGRRVGCRARRRSAAAGLGAWAVGRPTLHGGPVRLRLRLGRHLICYTSHNLYNMICTVRPQWQ